MRSNKKRNEHKRKIILQIQKIHKIPKGKETLWKIQEKSHQCLH